jgi:hypothetical protein
MEKVEEREKKSGWRTFIFQRIARFTDFQVLWQIERQNYERMPINFFAEKKLSSHFVKSSLP